jgi:uncharacterized protein (DUF2141 family)
MKRPVFLIVAIATLCLPGAALAGDLVLSLMTREAGGTLAVAIYRDAESFRRSEAPVRTVIVPRTGPTTTVTIRDLPPGRYAVGTFHDTDGNGRLTTWPIGLPREAYGFSRDARGQVGPPSFDSAAFDLPVTGGRQAFTLK